MNLDIRRRPDGSMSLSSNHPLPHASDIACVAIEPARLAGDKAALAGHGPRNDEESWHSPISRRKRVGLPDGRSIASGPANRRRSSPTTDLKWRSPSSGTTRTWLRPPGLPSTGNDILDLALQRNRKIKKARFRRPSQENGGT
ncbi:hypothetical protein ACVENA_11910 [Sphingopyxis sp. 550A]